MPEIGENTPTCTYCGETASDRDHVIPVAAKAGGRHFDCHWVWACSECNGLLGDKALYTVRDRSAFVAGAIRRKNWQLLGAPAWSADDIEEADLTGRLLREVRALERKRSRVLARITFAEIGGQSEDI